MLIFLVLLVSLVFYKIKYCKMSYYNDYIKAENMLSWKGIFVILIFLSHISNSGYFDNNLNLLDTSYLSINAKIGQLVVVLFLFLSGYGILFQINKRGKEYVESIFSKRFLKTLLHFDIIIVIFIIVQFILGERYSLLVLAKSLIGLESVGNSNWYIFAILYLYLTTYLSFKISKGKNIGVLINFLFILLYIIVARKYVGFWWYDSIMCYIYGMLFYLYREKIEKFIQTNYILYTFLLIIPIVGYFANICIFRVYPYNYLIYFTLNSLFLLSFIILFSMKFRIKNKILDFFGKNIFGIYILQRLAFIILSYFELNKVNKYVFVCISLILTILLTIAVNKILNKVDQLVFKV